MARPIVGCRGDQRQRVVERNRTDGAKMAVQGFGDGPAPGVVEAHGVVQRRSGEQREGRVEGNRGDVVRVVGQGVGDGL